MIDLDVLVVTILWVLELSRKIPYLVAWWQKKEYRWDRMLIHLGTNQGRQLITGPAMQVRVFLLFLALLTISDLKFSYSGLINLVPAVVLFVGAFVIPLAALFYTGLLVRALKRLPARGWTLRPDMTPKAIGVTGTLAAFVSGMYAYGFFVAKNGATLTSMMLLTDILLLPASFIVVGIFTIPTWYWRREKVKQAEEKLAGLSIRSVGITGSYGKSSTKYFLHHLLAGDFDTLTTSGSVNTLIGLSQVVIDEADEDTEVFIAEMGAYKRGEIRRMCELVHPEIGILTAINTQHQSLFGSMEAVEKAKYELIEAVPEDGLAVFNADDERVRRLAEETEKAKKLYSARWPDRVSGMGALPDAHMFVRAKDIEVGKESLSFILKFGSKRGKRITAPLLGRHTIENLLAAITVADYLGLSSSRIAERLKNIQMPEGTFRPVGKVNGAVLIDDTGNANPDGVIAAARYLDEAWIEGRRVVVLQPMIELGSFAREEHERVGAVLAETVDRVFVVNGNYYDALVAGVGDKADILEQPMRAATIVELVGDMVGAGDVVLFEGKETATVLDLLRERSS